MPIAFGLLATHEKAIGLAIVVGDAGGARRTIQVPGTPCETAVAAFESETALSRFFAVCVTRTRVPCRIRVRLPARRVLECNS